MMRSVQDRKDGIIGTLRQIRRDAGEPEIGTREVELVDLGDPVDRAALRDLRQSGMIHRSNGWVWVTEKGYEA